MIDDCVALTERSDERDTMRKLVKKLALTVDGPLVIDSTEADVLKTALERLFDWGRGCNPIDRLHQCATWDGQGC